ncbi:hypothetical protein F5B22DRAFT_322802 [Xylaria bambusicola]|uniref:uncharacterized protein n=1 Tax=Xylaria bambusicola TaxID=326684 RepID=UPI0020072EE8|nr:uncharacterized protein F5B22DRAFT_322802 [Xylaria bambusicola]KAI0509473.1 hypothetical protein F5B22DRAFT_322802 [Xylaria bambusicola]
MTSLYELTIPFLIKALKSEQGLLAKTEGVPTSTTFVEGPEQKMWDLGQQIGISSIHARKIVHELTGKPFAFFKNEEGFSVDELKKQLDETIALLESVKPEEVDGKESQIVQAMLGQMPDGTPITKPMKAINYVEGYLKPNVYFHLTTLYDLLRWKGVPLGKGDYLSAFLVIEQ